MNEPAMTEQDGRDFLLAARILHEVGALPAERVAYLDESAPGWNLPLLTDDDYGHALTVDHEELNAAIETWWNAQGLSETPMSFAEIRAKAAAEA